MNELVSCTICGRLGDAAAPRCPSCGAYRSGLTPEAPWRPAQPGAVSPRGRGVRPSVWLGAMFGTWVALFTGGPLASWFPVLGAWLPALPYLAAFAAAWLVGSIALERMSLAGSAREQELPPPAAAPPAAAALAAAAALRTDEARIAERLREIEAQRARIDDVWTMVDGEGRGGALVSVREKLEYAREVLDDQHARHRARLWVIALALWQERLARLTAGNGAAAGIARHRLEALAAIAGDGEGHLRTWEADSRAASTREGSRCIVHMRDLLKRCEGLREGIIVQEAMIALRGIVPADDAERTALLPTEPLESLQTDLGEGGSLARALAELEMEYERLQDDQDEARDVERFLGELESGHP